MERICTLNTENNLVGSADPDWSGRFSLRPQNQLKPLYNTAMQPYDDDLTRFDSQGALPLPETQQTGYVEHDGARIWYSSCGSGIPLILLHGGLGHSGNFGWQIPALVKHGYRAVLIDSRGHGHSTRDARPYTYLQMAADVRAVMDNLHIQRAALAGWSDGACTALILAHQTPERVTGVFFFACNMDPSGAKVIQEYGPTLQHCISRHKKDYAQLSPTPDDFQSFSDAVGRMQRTQPDYSAADLACINLPVAIVHSQHDEFILREHAEYLARSLPAAQFIDLPEVSHFAPLQRPDLFNSALLTFLGSLQP